MKYLEYEGMNYEQASRAAKDLVYSAYRSGETFGDLVERLAVLKRIASMDKEARENSTRVEASKVIGPYRAYGSDKFQYEFKTEQGWLTVITSGT